MAPASAMAQQYERSEFWGGAGIASNAGKPDGPSSPARTRATAERQRATPRQRETADFDRYPSDEEGIKVLWDKTALGGDEAEQKKWRGYLEDPMPNDVWERAWGYRQKSTHGDESKYDIWSNGPDGQEGTEDDVTSWPKEGSGESSGSGTPSSSGSR